MGTEKSVDVNENERGKGSDDESQNQRNLTEVVIHMAKNITLEPMILMYIGSLGIINGSEVQTNLKLWKVCHLTLNYTEEVCDNLSEHNETQNEVQKYVNNFDLVGNFLGNVPGLIYCIFAGALSDK